MNVDMLEQPKQRKRLTEKQLKKRDRAIRKSVRLALRYGPMTKSEITEAVGKHTPEQIYNAIRELRDCGDVTVTDKAMSCNGRPLVHVYSLTHSYMRKISMPCEVCTAIAEAKPLPWYVRFANWLGFGKTAVSA
jgi:hypothetical protein